MSKQFLKLIVLMTIIGGLFFWSNHTGQASESDTESYIHVTTTEEDGNTVQGSPIVTAVPNPNKPVAQVVFSAKAINEPDELYYPYAPISNPPYSWTWPTGNPWVPDGEYMLKMDITYESGEVETITKEIVVDNYVEPNAPESPKNLHVTSRTGTSVSLAWSSATSTKLFNYEIYQNGEKIGETKNTEYHVEGLSPDTLYTFRVKAKDIYNNVAIDDNSIAVLTNSSTLPLISEIKAPEPNGVTPGSGGYSGAIQLSVNAEDPSVDKVEFYVKTYDAPESDYWKFPNTSVNEDTYYINWDTTSAPDTDVIIKAVAFDEDGQFTTVTRVFLVDNEQDGYVPPSWDPADTPPANYMIAYLAGWATYGSFDIVRDLDASRLTHVNYAFALVGDDLKIKMSDPVQDPMNFEELGKLKEKYPHLKTTIAIGGWGGSANFSEAAATEETRNMFADSVVDFIVEHGFDGVDIDWEYPVTGGGPGTYPNPDDRENFPLLLQTLREKLDAQGEVDGVYYTLSIAGAANTGFIQNTQMGTSHEYLDYVQVMTYDIHGTWESLADFTAPLYDDNGKTWSVDKAIQAYIDAGVPRNKLVMGVPFYGYRYQVTSTENNGLRQPFSSSGSVTYNSIIKNDYLNNGYVRYWDEGTQVPYLFNEEESIFISHDDEESITLKAEYIREQGLGGVMIWEISQDHGIDLLDSLYQVLKDPIQPQIEQIDLSVANNQLVQGDEETINLFVHLTNGEKLDLAEANVQWYSSDEGILTIENGKIKANNAGTATIYATFHYLDEEITTERITITVVATPDSLDEQLNKLYEENKIANPLYKQLINRLRQVQHHHEKGNSAQANHHLDKFLEHLLRSNIDEEINDILVNNAESIRHVIS